jgi:hypothetical protein
MAANWIRSQGAGELPGSFFNIASPVIDGSYSSHRFPEALPYNTVKALPVSNNLAIAPAAYRVSCISYNVTIDGSPYGAGLNSASYNPGHICAPDGLGLGLAYQSFEAELRSLYRCYETLAAYPVSLNRLSILGGQLYEPLLKAQSALHEVEARESLGLETWYAEVSALGECAGSPRTLVPTFAEILEFCDSPRTVPWTSTAVSVLALVLSTKRKRHLLRRFSRDLQVIKRILRQATARFCGFSWTRRFWFLLHGSHPPKTEVWPALEPDFGCA